MDNQSLNHRLHLSHSMVKKALTAFCLLITTVPLVGFLRPNPSARQAVPALIALHEAEILIYMLPQAQELRNQGMDIGWELQTSPKLNQQDFYTFWVVNSKRPNVQGSVTIGYFSGNKHTADVWENDSEKFVSTKEIEGIKRILRQAHRIDESVPQKFSSLHPNM